ncbi:TIM-barrel domain-containing protein [Rhodanobacter glycinis]|uniref:Alpha-glucosidase, glycosyl hydrolase family GH31 n=1 Tax=Rhodanobacter glycinis TaxID=582702 RepID=A0A1I4FL43_9GAMM|nr:TIM-barrel domain-containing protein [Rhodanobacter glycinis]SFL18638.1 Alpha-glucosidase, glycosyl hydrolase family GH31 [Rhodanobacter glycinis]
MSSSILRTTTRRTLTAALATGLLLAAPALFATAAPTASAIHADTQGVAFRLGSEHVSIRFDGAGVVHVQALPAGASDAHTLVLDPHAKAVAVSGAHVHDDGTTLTLTSDRLVAIWHKQADTLELQDAQHHSLLTLDLAALAKGQVQLTHATDDALYGIHGYDKDENASAGLLRSGTQVAKAGEQGFAGAPFVWSTAGYGVLVDSDGASYALKGGRIDISGLSKPAMDVYLMAGDPPQLFGELARLSGHAPLFPKWSLGFINSQWGIDEKEFRQIIATYRAKHIPLDAFTFDFDWKNWGNDWGEFSWNPVKFPDGPTGKLKADMDKLGVHMTGIMKPRVHVNTVEGHYATAHDLWLPDEKVSNDYFSHKPVKDLDFDKPATRAWFFNSALKHSFDTGIVGWWNDEADTTKSDTQFLNMQRSIYDGQRAYSNLRVWSINRDFWLGAQRYAYGLWSGDIDTGFKSMAAQRQRMLSAISVGEMQWGMDGGGFNGHPSDENYARWIEFGAFTPIFRVHGTFGQKRQPWTYGPIAEKAATKAIRLRYKLLPYMYAYQHQDHAHGVGLVRPLAFAWPHDAKVRNDTSAWLFGQWLLVSPVVQQGQTVKHIYLPAGRWTDWFTGKVYAGGQTIAVTVDAKNWLDIPLFIRDGAIIPTWPPMDYVGQHPVTTLSVDMFPADHATHFDYYDDDGDTYAYEHGHYFSQQLTTQREGDSVHVDIAASRGSYAPALKFYLLKVHGAQAANVTDHGHALPALDSLDALEHANGEGWAHGHDRYGEVTWVRVAAAKAQDIVLASKNRKSTE